MGHRVVITASASVVFAPIRTSVCLSGTGVSRCTLHPPPPPTLLHTLVGSLIEWLLANQNIAICLGSTALTILFITIYQCLKLLRPQKRSALELSEEIDAERRRIARDKAKRDARERQERRSNVRKSAILDLGSEQENVKASSAAK